MIKGLRCHRGENDYAARWPCQPMEMHDMDYSLLHPCSSIQSVHMWSVFLAIDLITFRHIRHTYLDISEHLPSLPFSRHMKTRQTKMAPSIPEYPKHTGFCPSTVSIGLRIADLRPEAEPG